MTSPALAKTKKGVRHYIDPTSGDLRPSLTALLTHTDNGPLKDGLTSWAMRIGVETAVENRDSLTDFYLTGEGVKVVSQRLVRKAHVVRNFKADRGTAVHALSERIADGEFIDEAIAEAFFEGCWPFVQQFHRFMADWQPDVVWQERTVFNDALGIAGTADMLARLDGINPDTNEPLGLVLIDLKTSRDVKAPYLIQTAGYALADVVAVLDDDGGLVATEPMPAVDHAAILHLREDGYSLHVHKPDVEMVASILSAAQTLSDFALFPPLIPEPIRPPDQGDMTMELNSPATESTNPKTQGAKSEGGSAPEGAHVDILRERIIALKDREPTLLDPIREAFDIGAAQFWASLTAAVATKLDAALTKIEGFDGGATTEAQAVMVIADGIEGAEVVQSSGSKLMNETMGKPSEKARELMTEAKLEADQIDAVIGSNSPWTYDKVRNLAERLGVEIEHQAERDTSKPKEVAPEPEPEVAQPPTETVEVSAEALGRMIAAFETAAAFGRDLLVGAGR